jgi:hypothetical protein
MDIKGMYEFTTRARTIVGTGPWSAPVTIEASAAKGAFHHFLLSALNDTRIEFVANTFCPLH